MTEPLVCAVMLTANRPELAKRAVAAFRAQTYQNKRLVVLNSGQIDLTLTSAMRGEFTAHVPNTSQVWTIGALRNAGAILARAQFDADIICHWDDDDWSHPNRIAEQVALLQATGADCVGYNEMLFWDQRGGVGWPHIHLNGDECPGCEYRQAWRYSNPNPRYALGTSLCYWRRVWEARPFPDLHHGEDTEWIRGLNCVGMSGLQVQFSLTVPTSPRMIARIHSGNSSSAYDPIEMARHNVLPRSERQWSRVPEWDQVCREVIEG